MTIDERLEALTQSLELLTYDVRELRAHAEQTDAQIKALTRNEAAMMDAIGRLANIAATHDERIERLEEGPQ